MTMKREAYENPLTREEYNELFGPTAGDRIRLADTALSIQITEDWAGGPGRSGNEVVFGGGKVIRESMGQSSIPAIPARAIRAGLRTPS